MMIQSTLSYLDALYQNIDPTTGECLPQNSIFQRDKVRYALANLRTALHNETNDLADPGLADHDLIALCQEIKELKYTPDVIQLTHICRGSRRVVDPNLRALEAFGRYRAVYSATEIERQLRQFAKRYPTFFSQAGAASSPSKRQPPAWKKEPYFDENHFDKLEPQKAKEIEAEVQALDVKKSSDSLPEYMQLARVKYPRAYEPWTKAEHAILLEAMCYTNRVERLAPLLGRSSNSVKQKGQRLIWESKQRVHGK